MNKKKRNTIILIIILLLVSGIGYAVPRIAVQMQKKKDTSEAEQTDTEEQGETNSTKKYAVVQSYDEDPIKLDLSENQEIRIGGDSGYNIIEVKDGTVFVKEADCPDQICVDQGEIHESYGVIACLPHQLIITVETENDAEDQVDSAAY